MVVVSAVAYPMIVLIASGRAGAETAGELALARPSCPGGVAECWQASSGGVSRPCHGSGLHDRSARWSVRWPFPNDIRPTVARGVRRPRHRHARRGVHPLRAVVGVVLLRGTSASRRARGVDPVRSEAIRQFGAGGGGRRHRPVTGGIRARDTGRRLQGGVVLAAAVRSCIAVVRACDGSAASACSTRSRRSCRCSRGGAGRAARRRLPSHYWDMARRAGSGGRQHDDPEMGGRCRGRRRNLGVHELLESSSSPPARAMMALALRSPPGCRDNLRSHREPVPDPPGAVPVGDASPTYILLLTIGYRAAPERRSSATCGPGDVAGRSGAGAHGHRVSVVLALIRRSRSTSIGSREASTRTRSRR